MISEQAQQPGLSSGLCERDKKNARIFFRWTLVWGVTFVIAHLFLGPGGKGIAEISDWYYSIVVFPLAACLFMIRAFLSFLELADELIRLILLRAAACGFGSVFVLGIVFSRSAQIFGDWEDSGEITWFIGFMIFELSFSRQWKNLDA